MGGILRNESREEREPNAPGFDRQQVRKNTEINAKLGSEGRELRERLHISPDSSLASSESSLSDKSSTGSDGSSGKKPYPKTKAPTALHANELQEDEGFVEPQRHDVDFDEEGIDDWNKHRGKTQKILEPNTPYMGTAADTEYYDDDPVPEDLDLGGSA